MHVGGVGGVEGAGGMGIALPDDVRGVGRVGLEVEELCDVRVCVCQSCPPSHPTSRTSAYLTPSRHDRPAGGGASGTTGGLGGGGMVLLPRR